MALGDLAGKARANPRNQEAMGECDRDGPWWPLSKLTRQFQWAGSGLRDTGYLVCPRCLDRPFEQYRTLILPPDPVPKINPRQSHDTTGQWPIGVIAGPTSPQNQGFTQYVLDSVSLATYPTMKADVLAQVAAVSGIPTPSTGVTDWSITLLQNQTQSLIPINPIRTWLLIYNPAGPQAEISLGTALLGAITNLILGPGEALFWATSQGLGNVTTSAITAIGLTPGMPLFAWDATYPAVVTPGGFEIATPDGGILVP